MLCRKALEAKAALYEKLSRGQGLRELEREEEEGGGGEEGGHTYMVDFTKKVYEVSKGGCALIRMWGGL